MIAAVDVGYFGACATAAAITFRDWADSKPDRSVTVRIDNVLPYQPGAFYRRELPCLLAAIEALGERPDLVVVDGYVVLGAASSAGLGMHLWRELRQEIPVVGVAKTAFRDTPPESEVLRGRSGNPLFVTAVGIPLAEARMHVLQMHGEHRIPALLTNVDRLSRRILPSRGGPEP